MGRIAQPSHSPNHQPDNQPPPSRHHRHLRRAAASIIARPRPPWQESTVFAHSDKGRDNELHPDSAINHVRSFSHVKHQEPVSATQPVAPRNATAPLFIDQAGGPALGQTLSPAIVHTMPCHGDWTLGRLPTRKRLRPAHALHSLSPRPVAGWALVLTGPLLQEPATSMVPCSPIVARRLQLMARSSRRSR